MEPLQAPPLPLDEPDPVGSARVVTTARADETHGASAGGTTGNAAAAGGCGDTVSKSREPRAESREPRAESREPRAESREPRAESREPRAESREPRAESREPRAESREPRAESRARPRAESREPRAESREPRAESREPRAESREPRAGILHCGSRHSRLSTAGQCPPPDPSPAAHRARSPRLRHPSRSAPRPLANAAHCALAAWLLAALCLLAGASNARAQTVETLVSNIQKDRTEVALTGIDTIYQGFTTGEAATLTAVDVILA